MNRRIILLLVIGLAVTALPAVSDTPIDVATIAQAKALGIGQCVRVSAKTAATDKSDFAPAAPSFAAAVKTGNVQSTALTEASGLAASRKNANVLWAQNDSGDTARAFAMDTTGKHLGIYNLTGASAVDWEDMAIGPGPLPGHDYLYMADIGDNNAVRSSIRVYRVEEPVVSANQNPVTVNLTGVTAITLQYEDGARDAETLMVEPVTCDLYIVSKRESKSRLYRASAADIAAGGTVILRFKAELPWGWATGGDISPTGNEIIVRGYANASLWKRPPGSDLWSALRGTAHTMPLAAEPQGEAICFAANGQGYYTTSEGVNQPVYYYARTVPPNASHFYLEEPQRCAGIRVVPTAGVSALLDRGASVTVTGYLGKTVDDEEQLTDAIVEIQPPTPDPVRPVGMSGGWIPANFGMLARIWGRITQVDASGSYFCMDDGGGSVRVAFDGRAYDPGKFLAITGICSCYKDSGNVQHPLLLVRSPEDIAGL